MGWANCGDDSKGRLIGYAHDATCDAPGCAAHIHRGIAYACGGMHGELDYACEGYFCDRHRSCWLPVDGRVQAVCDGCYAEAKNMAIADPEDCAELIAFFVQDEGKDWMGDG